MPTTAPPPDAMEARYEALADRVERLEAANTVLVARIDELEQQAHRQEREDRALLLAILEHIGPGVVFSTTDLFQLRGPALRPFPTVRALGNRLRDLTRRPVMAGLQLHQSEKVRGGRLWVATVAVDSHLGR